MGSHPINLAVRFLLEVATLLSMGFWGWRQGEGWLRFVLAALIPVVAAIIWSTFAVPADPSRSGGAPIPVQGLVRLAIEATVFGFGIWTLYDTASHGLAGRLGSSS